jgi:hypothetical protein
VNKNINSPYYGYLYVADGTLKKIWICPPVKTQDGTGANAYNQDGAPTANPPTSYINVPGGDLTMGVTVGPDDTVWIGALNTASVYSAPPVPPSGSDHVDAVVQITGVGTVRGLTVTGPVTNAKVYVSAQSPAAVNLYTVTAPDASTVGTSANVYKRDLSGAPYSLATGNGVYAVGVDPAGNAYVANGIGGAAATRLYKILPDGTVDAGWTAIAPAGTPTLGALASAAFVADKSYPGGGYLYFNTATGTGATSGQWVLRFDLNGTYLDGFGPTVATPPANYSVVTFRGTTQPSFLSADDLGNTYHRSSATNSGTVKVFKHAPFLAATADATSAGGAVKSSATAVDGVVYFGSDDGKLYAYTTADGNPVAGFPVDIAAATATGVKVQSRPSVYITTGGKQIYFTTDRGDIGRVNADGTGLTVINTPIPGANNTGTPAVTADGTIYVGGSTAIGAGVTKLDADLNVLAYQQLGDASATVSSVAVNGNSVYVGLTGGAAGDIVVLKSSDLTPQAAGVATGEGVTAPPYVNGLDAYVGTLAGNFYKVNSITFAPDPTFGLLNAPSTPGKAAIGEPLPGSAFVGGTALAPLFYVGSANGKLWQVNGTDGTFNVLYDTGDSAASIPGVVVNPDSNTIAFGTSAGLFYQIPAGVSAAQVFRGYGAFNTTPTLDRSTGRFLIGSDDMNVYAFSSR